MIDRDTAARLGLTPQMIDNALYDAFGQRQVSTMYEGLNQYHVVMEVAQQFQQSPDALNTSTFIPRAGQEIPLSAFTHYRAVDDVAGRGAPGAVPGDHFFLQPGPECHARRGACSPFRNMEHTLVTPATIHPSFQGTAQAFQDSLATQPYLILAALVTVYLVLGILYENYIHPITILSTLPSAGVGALLALLHLSAPN